MSETNENGYTTSYSYDPGGHGWLSQVTFPEGNSISYGYDARGNVTSSTRNAKAGSSLYPLTSSATYPSSCTASGITSATCNKPITSTDAAGNVTNYYWNTDGSPSYVEAPATTGGGARPRTSYGYTTVQAWLKTSSGSFALAADPVTLPIKIWSCQTTSACVDTSADAAKTTISYYGGSSSTGTNLLVSSATAGSGTGSPSTTTAYGYDAIGNVTNATDPMGAVSQTLYNAMHEVTGIIGPDPDGAGPKRNRAVDIQRNADGTENYRQAGTVNPDASGFTGLQLAYTTYDAFGRKVTERLNPATNGAATAAYSLTQYSYDAVGRLECTAIRMTPSTYGSLPASACTQTSAGTDRISKTIYEWAGLPYQVQTGVGTSLARNEVTYVHNLNGQTTSVTDAKGSVTSYSYDGHLRPSRTCYNTSVATCTTGSPTDFVSVVYGTSGTSTGKMVSRKLRGNATQASIGYSYDALGRMTGIDYPGPGLFDSDVGFTYDLLGRTTQALDGNTHRATFGYDALGRVTSQGDSLSARTMGYDAAGRRTSLSWPGGPTINYEYDATGAMTAIKEGTSTSLATFGYDDLGRRTSLTRGNGVVTSYGYDGGSRLTSMGLNLAGTARDLTLGFSYNAAGQITQRTADNDAYAWTQHYNVNRTYTTNALNQYSAIGSLNPTYDPKGNLVQAGSSIYSYDTKNELVITSDTGKQFYYDPLGRMDAVLPPSGTALAGFQYDGAHIADEYDPSASNAIKRRYVWGPGADEPLVWYEGSGTTDKRYLMADERGSVVAVTDANGNVTAINSYDEYGIPASTNMGRFQYTGQAWIPELGMYNYKARIYSPTLGRFMQTDPIEYGDGINWYNYVRGDPVNGIDPSGLICDGCRLDHGGAPSTADRPVEVVIIANGFDNHCYACDSPPGVLAANPGLYVGVSNDLQPDSTEQPQSDIVVTGKRHSPRPAAPPITVQPGVISLPGLPSGLTQIAAPAPYNPKIHYCGPEGGATYPSGTWNKACYTHDVCYGTPGASKSKCDGDLGYEIKEQCEASDPGDPTCTAAALIYYWAVFFGGAGPFERAQRGSR